MTPTMDNGQGKRRPVDPMRHHRENGWDYRGRAIYHFTLPVEERYPLFGTLDGESAETAFVRLNPYGRRVCQMLCGLAQFYAGKGFALKVLAQKVMSGAGAAAAEHWGGGSRVQERVHEGI